MKVLLAMTLFAWIFWSRPAQERRDVWPESVPVFAGLKAEWAIEREGGKAAFVSLTTDRTPADVLAAIRAAYLAAGWNESPVHPADTLIFTSGEGTAAILAETADGKTRVTAVQRK